MSNQVNASRIKGSPTVEEIDNCLAKGPDAARQLRSLIWTNRPRLAKQLAQRPEAIARADGLLTIASHLEEETQTICNIYLPGPEDGSLESYQTWADDCAKFENFDPTAVKIREAQHALETHAVELVRAYRQTKAA